MPVLLILLLAVVAEITVMVTVGNLIGVLPTILLLIAATVLGGALLRREGTKAFAALQDAVFARRAPARELVDGMLIAGAGFLVIVPGFISDVLAILLLLPPTRAVVRRWVTRRAEIAVANQQRRTIVVDSFVVDDQPHIVIPESRRDGEQI
ncbi:FxsA family protein [Actinokineospora sp. HUAS TT18]|uniref:FxsA family protein n=1 Tax=Actinokineospora sp. HUAS TT18 TaxID=3447451 RepID=UPI003F51E40C